MDSQEVKAGYKLTEIGVIPEDWEVKLFRDICFVNQGLQIAIKNRSKIPNSKSKKYITIQFINKEKDVEYINEYSSSVCCSKEDILMTRTGNTGIIVTDVEGVFHNNFFKVNYDKEILDKYYLIAYLRRNSVQKLILEKAGTSTITDLNHNDFYSLPIIIPPLPEQEKIAQVLSDFDSAIAQLDKLINKKRNVKQGTMQQLLTGKKRLPGFSGEWKRKTFGDCFNFLSVASNSRSDLSNNGSIGYIHYGDIHTKYPIFIDCKKQNLPLIKEEKLNNVSFVKEGDLIIADASEDYEGIGISVEIRNLNSKKIVAGLHTLLLREKQKCIANGFKAYLTKIPSVKTNLQTIANGISVYGISKTNLKNVVIPLPPSLEEQKAIAQVLSDMDAEIEALEKKRDKYQAMKQGMMQELLTGKTRLIDQN